MKNFARVTKLGNIGGRADYISDQKRQEKVVCASEAVDWKPYQAYERAHQKSDRANNEGREVVVQLPNEWADSTDLQSKAAQLAKTAAGKDTDLQWAVHWNKRRTNLHLHVIFSERTYTGEITRYDRDIYHTLEGKVSRSKADRARDPEGNVLPPIHRKEEIANAGFSSKDTRYKHGDWVPKVKESLHAHLERLGAVLKPPHTSYELHQYHQGKGSEAATITLKNRFIEANCRCKPRKGGLARKTARLGSLRCSTSFESN